MLLAISMAWLCAAADERSAVFLKRQDDGTSALASEALSQQPPMGTRVLSGARLFSAMVIAGVVPQTRDDAAAKKRFREAREEAKRTSDPVLARLALQRAVQAALSLSFAEIEFRQTGLVVALQELLKAHAAANDDAQEIVELLEELAIRNQFDLQTALPPMLVKRYAKTVEAMRKQAPVSVELLAQGDGEWSLDGGKMRPLVARDFADMLPGPHEVFVRWKSGAGWTRRIVVTADAQRALRFDEALETRFWIEPEGLLLRGGSLDEATASLAATMGNVDESWCIEQTAPGRVLVTAFAGEHLSRTVIEVAEPQLDVSVVRMALAAARSGRVGEKVQGYETKARGGNEFLVSKKAETLERPPVYKQWWFWTVIGVAVAGAAAGVTAGIVVSQNRTQAPNEIQLQLRFGL